MSKPWFSVISSQETITSSAFHFTISIILQAHSLFLILPFLLLPYMNILFHFPTHSLFI